MNDRLERLGNMRKYIIKFFIVAMCLLSILSTESFATKPRSLNQEEIDNTGATSLIEIKEKEISTKDDYKEKYNSEESGTIAYWIHKINLYIWLASVILGVICLVSLVLNCIRKNTGKAIFSGIGLIVPIISIVLSNIGQVLYTIEENMIGFVLAIFAVILEIIFGILALIFCFSKRKIPNEK
ncbi:MAG: hypothetical protein J6J36_02485 [Clostridia bacterium]|nr:hypothetical protein [Clostridia bacterium]